MADTVTKGGQKLSVSEYKQLKTFRNNEIARVTASKLIEDSKQTGVSGYNGTYAPSDEVVNRLSESTATNIEDFSNIFQALPDTKIAMEIWTSCIVTPKDGLTESLVWSVDNEGSEYSSQLFTKLLDKTRTFFEKEYDIFKHLKPAVEDALFKTGSYVLALVPESTVDDVINGKSAISNEAVINAFFKKDKNNQYQLSTGGILGPVNKDLKSQKQTTGLESLIHNATVSGSSHRPPCLYTTITDNPDILKLPKALHRSKKQNLTKILRQRYSLESMAKVNLTHPKTPEDLNSKDPGDKDEVKDRRWDTKVKDSVAQGLYKQREYDHQPVIRLNSARNASRLPVGHPLELKLPSSCVIPVHVPGNPRDIVGAFIILDEYGNPLDSSKYTDLFNEQREKSQQTINAAGNIIKSMTLFGDSGCKLANGTGDDTLNELARTYAALFEEDLIQRFNNGVYGENIEIARADEAWRIMFARACAAMRTQLLYVPSELLTYFAFDYNRYGLGKSLLEDGKSLATMRAAMQYSQIYANILNNIGRRKLVMSIDEDTPDPMKAMAIMRTEYTKANNWAMPLLSQGPIDSINTLRESNIDVVLEGDHPALPSTKFDVEDTQTQRHSPDEDIIEKTKNLHIASFGLPVSSVDETQQTEFATVALQNNALFNKRTVNYQRIFNNDFLYSHITKYTLNSGRLIKELSLIIKENKDLLTDEQRQLSNTFPIIEEFLERLSVTLPSPDGRKLDDQKQDFDKYTDFIESLIEKSFPDEVLSRALPEDIRDDAMMVRDTMKMIMIKRYIDDHGYLPGLDNILDIDNVDDTIEAEVQNALEPVSRFATELILAMDKVSKKTNDPSLKGIAESTDDSYGGSSDYSSDGDEDEDSGDDAGGDDFDFGGDISDGSDDDTGDENSDESGESEEEPTREDDIGF